MPHVTSIQTALPQDLGDPAAVDPMDRPWRTAFAKRPVAGPVRVDPETIVGDGVADRKNHGGRDKAVLGYAAAHYPEWQALLGPTATAGGFGENLTLAGHAEADVCVGDVYEIGDGGVVLEVSQPRQPCWKIGRRWRRADVLARVTATGRTGWYFRVVRVGSATAGDVVRLVDRPFPALTVAALNDMMYGRRPVAVEAVDCAALAAGWRRHLRQQLG